MSSNVRLLPVLSETLRQMLCLPQTTTIVAAGADATHHDVVLLKIEDPQFSEVEQGARIPQVSAEYDIVNARTEFNSYVERVTEAFRIPPRMAGGDESAP